MQEWLIQLVYLHPYLAYLIVVLVAWLEGPIVSLLCGVLVKAGYFYLVPVYIALMVGDLFGDVVWYFIGKYFGHRFIAKFGKYFDITEESVAKVSDVFHKYKHRILIISKLTNGFGFALVTLITSGMIRIPLSRFMIINILGQFFWTGSLLFTGYFFSNLYETVDSVFAKMSVVCLFIIAFIGFRRISKHIKNKTLKIDNNNI